MNNKLQILDTNSLNHKNDIYVKMADNKLVDDKPVDDKSQGSESLTTPQENEILTLTHSIIEWRRLKDEATNLKQQLKERSKKIKVLEEVILRVMKNHNIGALDLKSSGGRVLYKKQKRQAGLGQKNMLTLMSAGLQSEDKASELMKYIQEHRDTVIKESIAYENSQ
jgi:hypothetical protein